MSELTSYMQKLGVEVTRDNVIAVIWGSTPPEPWTPENEDELPVQVQDWSRFDVDGMDIVLNDFDPYHEPAGSPIGGRFARKEGSGNAKSATGTAEKGLQERRRVSGGSEQLAAPSRADLTTPLKGLPTKVNVPGVGEITAGPYDKARQAAYDYMKKAGLEYHPPTEYVKVDPERATRIAAEYDKMKHDPQDPEVKAAYAAMIKETVAQYHAIEKTGLDIEFIDYAKDGDPYAASPRLATEDVRNNNHLWVFPTSAGFGTTEEFDPSENPLLADTGIEIRGHKLVANDLFRIVHDYFGHIKEGNGFRADGEENAWRSHSAMFSPLARRAMTSETRGQNSWVNYGPYGESNRTASSGKTHFADQKTGLMPEWVTTEASGASTQTKDFDPAQPRDPTGVSTGGRWTTSVASKIFSPEDAKTFRVLKKHWTEVNNQLLEQLDTPDSPEANKLMDELRSCVKKMYKLNADPGNIEGIGLPGGPRDVVIIGGGPGGLAAATMGGVDNLDTLLVEAQPTLGGQAKESSRIENYPGFPIGVSGEKLTKAMAQQAERTGADIQTSTRVTGMSFDYETGLKRITLSNGEIVQARAVVIAGGLEFRHMDFQGSDGPGVVYGDGKALAQEGGSGDIVVVGGSNGAAQAALGVARTARHVTLIARSPIAVSMSGYQVDAVRNHPKITVIEEDSISILQRNPTTNRPATLVTQKGVKVPCDALGLYIGSAPNTSWVPPEIPRDKTGRITANSDLTTTMPGVFAIGDVRAGGMGRIGAAVGEGQMAMRDAFSYFDKLKDTAAHLEPALKKDAQPLDREEANARWDKIVDAVFALDKQNPWFGQTIEPPPRHKLGEHHRA